MTYYFSLGLVMFELDVLAIERRVLHETLLPSLGMYEHHLHAMHKGPIMIHVIRGQFINPTCRDLRPAALCTF